VPCDFYCKTGHCRYGAECVFDHPPEFQVPLTALGLPFRQGEPVCKFYKQNNACKFGPACKFHHPPQVPVYAGSALLESPDG
jgi:serine/threonine-protein kinase/endoribonuclease IRE1